MPAPNITQFGLNGAVVAGQMDLTAVGNNVITGQVAASVSTPFVAGQAVKMEDSAGGVPKYLPLAANTDVTNGIVIYHPIYASRAAGKPFEVALRGSVIYMTAGAAIARNAAVEVVAATSKVITSGGTNPIIGRALDKAAADGDVIRVYLETIV